MNKIFKLFLVFGLLITTFIFEPSEVAASSCSGGQYEVLTAQRAGAGFSFVSCHNDLSSAEVAMNGLPNNIDNTPVIRYNDIVIKMSGGIIDISDASMSRAIGIYPTTSSNTSKVSINGVFGGEMGYIDSYISNGDLVRIKGKISGVEGWIKIDDYISLIPTAHLNIGNYYYRYFDDVANSYDLVHARTYNNVITPVTIGPAPSWMNDNTDYYSFDGIHFYNDYVVMSSDLINGNFDNANNTNYNYYQYLSSRTRTNYNSEELNNYLEAKGYNGTPGDPKESVLFKTGVHFISAQEKTGVNALMEYAWALHESAYGTSAIAMQKYNIFGVGAVDSAPMTGANPFTSVQECVEYHSKTWVSVGYSDPITDNRYYGTSLGNKITGYNVKYATDPYWAEGIAGTMYRIDKYLGFKDLDYYSIGIINNEVKDVIYNSSSVYQTFNGSQSLLIPDYPVTIIGQDMSNYTIMMDAPMRESDDQDCTFIQYSQSNSEYQVYDLTGSYPIGTLGPVCDYDYKFVGTISKTNVLITNHENFNNPLFLRSNITNIYENTFTHNTFSLKGRALIKGVKMDEDFKHSKKLVLKGIDNEYTFNVTDIDTYDETIDDVNYKFAGFEVNNIDFTSLEDDIYVGYIQIYDSLGFLMLETRLNDNTFIIMNDSQTYILDEMKLSQNLDGDLLFTKNTLEQEAIISISSYAYSDANITIEGELTLTGSDMTTDSSHTKKLVLKNTSDEIVRHIDLTNVDLGEHLINGVDYKYRGFSGTIDTIDSLDDGDYKLYIEVYDSSQQLIHSQKIEKADYANTINEHTFNNVKYSVLDRIDFTLQKLDLTLKEVLHVLDNSLLDGNTLKLSGYAFMLYTENTAADIVHKIVLKNSVNEYEFPATSTTGDYDLTHAYEHGVDYSKSWFEAEIDLDNVVPGDYFVYIDVSTPLYHGREELLNAYHIDQPSYSNVGSKSLEYFLNNKFFSRLELSVHNHNLLFDPTKASTVESIDVISSIGYEDDNIDVKGYSFLPGADNVSHDIKMYLVANDGTTYEMNKVAWDGTYDLSDAYKDGFDYGNPWYNFRYDLSTLPQGSYLIKTVLYQNGFEVGSELINSYNTDYSTPHDYNGNTYIILTNQEFRHRVEVLKQ